MWVIVHIPGEVGSLAFKSYSPREARDLPGFLSLILGDKAEVMTMNVPEMYMEYAPFTRVRDLLDFVNQCFGLITSKG